jgi:superfamily II RNA helicase
MISMGFHSTCAYLKQKLSASLKGKHQSVLEKVTPTENTFNSDIIFQMTHLEDQLKRTLDSSKDPRVKFEPDRWQVALLNLVDKNESAVICAPTSSGKTFISYYAMEKILRQNDTDKVVFVAPNKALANQIVAEVYTRFSGKTYPKESGAVLFAMLMPDYKINEASNCQVLVTVPTAFETLLSQKVSWLKNIKYVIIDEVQELNDSESGKAIEKIIHFVQCPILTLSATIGNLNEFYRWFSSIMNAKGMRVHKIVHTERFCDLKRFVYVPIDNTKDT